MGAILMPGLKQSRKALPLPRSPDPVMAFGHAQARASSIRLRGPMFPAAIVLSLVAAMAGASSGRSPVQAQAGTRFESVARFGGPLLAPAPTGDLVWLAQGRRVWAVKLADPTDTQDLGPGLSLPGEVSALAADGNLGLAAIGADLWALDLSRPPEPSLKGSLRLSAPAGQAQAVVQRMRIFQSMAYLRLEGLVADVLVDLRGETPRLVSGPPFALPADAVVEAMLQLRSLVAIKVRQPSPPAGVGASRILLYDHPLGPSSRLRGSMDVTADAWSTIVDGQEEHLRTVVAEDTTRVLTRQDWDLSDPRRPRLVHSVDIPPPDAQPGKNCERALAPIALTNDGRLYMACTDHIGSFITATTIQLWDPALFGSDQPWDTVDWAEFPLHHSIQAHGVRLLFVDGDGLHSYHGPSGEAALHPLVISAGGMVAASVQGLPSLLVNAGGLRRLSLAKPFDPVLVSPDRFGFGYSSGLSYDEGIAVIDFFGAGDIHRQSLMTTSVGGEAGFGPGGKIDLMQGGAKALWAQSGTKLAVVTGLGRLGLFRLLPDGNPRSSGEVMVPGGELAALAMQGDLLAALSLEHPSTHRDALTPLTFSLYRIDASGEDLRTERLVSRVMAPDASAATEPGLLMSGGWLAMSLTLRCGRQRTQGIAMLGLDPASGAVDQFPRAWLPGQGRALLLHDGYLFSYMNASDGAEPATDVRVLDIRGLAAMPWAWRIVGQLAVSNPGPMTVLDHMLYVGSGDAGIAIFKPDLAWASRSDLPTPTAPPTPPPLTPTEPSRPCLSPSPSATTLASQTAPPIPSATRTVPAGGTPAEGRKDGIWLPALSKG